MKKTHRLVFLLIVGTILFINWHLSPSKSNESDQFDISIYYPNRTEPLIDPKYNMETCFDMNKCKDTNLKVYVYPNNDEGQESSLVYAKFLEVLRKSHYYTDQPEKGCLFILSIDTIDRDRISENFVRDVDGQIKLLDKNIWNNGRNHLIYNFYHGTFPDYADHNLAFNYGYAMIARSSFSAQKLRAFFDLSFPLFHADHTFSQKDADKELVKLKRVSDDDKYFVSFKGKRYVYGIGSETRDSLYHLHNGESIVMMTTCKHNTDWKKFEDSRCEIDNEMYDKWDYNDLLRNSTFCLAPRGRRLASFRFIEALKAGCIPVILSDDWVLPFSEIIDWKKAVVFVPEKMSVLLVDQLGQYTYEQVKAMKEYGQEYYWKHLSNYKNIIETSIEVIFRRVKNQIRNNH